MPHIAFLRAVNVGGRIVKMAALKTSFEALGFADVKTFIASGNVTFESRKSAATLEAAIEKRLHADFGFPIATMIRSVADLEAALAFIERRRLMDGAVSLYVGFLKEAPSREAGKAVEALSNPLDRLVVEGRELYWMSIPGIGQSKLTGARIEKLLGVAATLRNVTTVTKLVGRSS